MARISVFVQIDAQKTRIPRIRRYAVLGLTVSALGIGYSVRATAQAYSSRAPVSDIARGTDSIVAASVAIIDPARFDTTISPCVDFYQYVNGRWINPPSSSDSPRMWIQRYGESK